MKELVQKVKQWGIDRGLDKVGHLAQAEYTLKETAELLDAYADSNIEEINDAIGDILVTLIVGASNDDDIYKELSEELLKDKYSHSLISTSENLQYSISYLTKDVFKLKILADHGGLSVIDYLDCLHSLSDVKDYINDTNDEYCSLKHCLQLAYNEIKDRTGKKVNGQFKKD